MLVAQNLSEAIFNRLSTLKHQTFLTLLNKDLSVNTAYSGAELLQKSERIAHHLQKEILAQRIILTCTDPANFVVLFLAVIFSGKIPIPVVVPKSSMQFGKLSAIANECDTTQILCDLKTANLLKIYQPNDIDFQCIILEQLINDSSQFSANQLKGFNSEGKDIAYVQYSSGSYGNPKGVALSHHQVLANVKAVSKSYGVNANTVFGIWLPLYHDMGLECVLACLLNGIKMVIISPLAFIQKPLIWLQMITKYQVTLSGGPPFAYQLCTAKITALEKSSLDLSSWNYAFSGAEIVREEVMERFISAFSECGLNKSAIYNSYGMAEATCYICGSKDIGLEADGIISAKLGVKPCYLFGDETENICVVDNETGEIVADGKKGEIYFAVKGMGYGCVKGVKNNQFILDSKQFDYSFDFSGSKKWFRTGDIGIKAGLLLWVLGRKNDMFKINGENVLAADVEIVAATVHHNLNAYGAAVFRIDDTNDNLANLLIETYSDFEVDSNQEELISQIKTKIFATFGLRLNQVLILKRGALDRTSSGKIRRNAIAFDYSLDKYKNKIYVC